MGGKRVGTGKHFFCAVTVLISFAFISCASMVEKQRGADKLQLYVEPVHSRALQTQPKKERHRDESKEHLLKGQQLLALGQYDAAIKENLQVLSVAPNRAPGDEAIFTIGLIYAYPKYQKKDHGKAVSSLVKIIKEYPQSNWAGHAKILLDILQENEKLKKFSSETSQENEKLKNVIEQSKKVDLEIEEKKRERAR